MDVLPPGKEDGQELTAGAAELPKVTDSLQKSIGGPITSEDGLGQSGDQLSNSSSSSSSSMAVTSSSSSSEVKQELVGQPAVIETRGSSAVVPAREGTEAQDDSTGSDAGARLVQAEVHASLENGEKETSGSSPSSEEKDVNSERRDQEEENDEDGSKKDDYSEGDLVDISAYSGFGEDDSGGSQLDDEEDEEDEEEYQPETSCSEMPGLPEEDEPPPSNRKIQFSTAPIKVSFCWIRLTLYQDQDFIYLMPLHNKVV